MAELRDALRSEVPDDDIVVTCGSYARREASSESDIDFFAIRRKQPAESGDTSEWMKTAKGKISAIVPIDPAADGAFAKTESLENMLQNVGGENDDNQKTTRRMLFLLEGEWLFNERGMKEVRRQLLERYIVDGIADHHLALFLLNDIIRYWRTMTVDYEFKTVEGDKPKPWGIRNIKLIFSRKMLYASGLFSVGMTANCRRERKIEKLEYLFSLPALARLEDICGATKMEKVLNCYNHFLDRLEDKSVREHLKSLRQGDRQDEQFRDLKNEGHQFTRELLKLFEDTFDPTHQIRHAVVF